MKKIVLPFIVCLQISVLKAQLQGTIIYERKMDMNRRMDDEQTKAMLPQFRTSRHLLMFSDSISVYKVVPEDEAPDPFDNGSGPRMMIRMGPGENGVLYRNFTRQEIKEQTEFADKKYIIDDTIRIQPWKLAEDTKVILGRTCKKATMTTPTGNEIIAWYAEDLATPAGPENYGGLPGAVLGIDMNKGEIVLTAIEIKSKINSKELAEPKDGKHITRADFQKKIEEVLGPAGPGGRRMIRMN
jgi:GLPGLI family protein